MIIMGYYLKIGIRVNKMVFVVGITHQTPFNFQLHSGRISQRGCIRRGLCLFS